MAQIFVKPAINPETKAPYKVRRPDRPTEFLPVEGAFVEHDTHWGRRLRDGSVEIADAPKTKKATSKE